MNISLAITAVIALSAATINTAVAQDEPSSPDMPASTSQPDPMSSNVAPVSVDKTNTSCTPGDGCVIQRIKIVDVITPPVALLPAPLPVDLDADNDDILDTDDKCPNEREVYNGVDDEDGCWDELKLSRGGTHFRIFAGGHFLGKFEENSVFGGIGLGWSVTDKWEADLDAEVGGGTCPGVVVGAGGALMRKLSSHWSLGLGVKFDYCLNLREDPMTGANLEEWRVDRFLGAQLPVKYQANKSMFVGGSVFFGYAGTAVPGDIIYRAGAGAGLVAGYTLVRLLLIEHNSNNKRQARRGRSASTCAPRRNSFSYFKK